MATRRTFLGQMSGAWAATALWNANAASIAEELATHPGTPDALSGDEDFWFEVGRAFTVDRSLINLNNGGVCPSPRIVQEAMKDHLDFSNKAPVYTMWRVLEPQQEIVRQKMAGELGCSPEEVAFTRNASEALQICQFGIDLERGDEVLTTNQDYPRMISTFRQRERREGIILRQFSIPTPCEDEDQIVDLFRKNINKKTKLILMCHVINLTGQVLPVRKVVAMAREKNIPVIVDGAHAFAHLDFTLPDLDCDYYGTSLHKWLFAPHGTGFLYVRKDKIRDLWPMMGAEEKLDDDIRKFEQIGTHPAANTLAIAEALDFHQGLGPARKLARMVFLRDYWADQVRDHDRIRFNTSFKNGFSGGIVNVGIDGIETSDLQAWLWKNHRILTSPITHDEFNGLRVSPSVYTRLEELDRFAQALHKAIKDGIEA